MTRCVNLSFQSLLLQVIPEDWRMPSPYPPIRLQLPRITAVTCILTSPAIQASGLCPWESIRFFWGRPQTRSLLLTAAILRRFLQQFPSTLPCFQTAISLQSLCHLPALARWREPPAAAEIS